MVYMQMSYSSAEDCTTLARDNYIQKTLQTFEEEEEELDDRTCTEYVIKYLDDMCGWIPDPTIQYRRNGSARTGGKTSQKNQGKQGRTDWGSLARRTGRNENQSSTLTEYEFKHYTNLKKYIEQYRRFHTCGGPLEKLSQSAYGRTKTVYYKNESGASDKPATQQSKSAESAEERRPQTQHHLPDAPRGGLVRNYEDPPPATAPRYHSLTDSVLRKRTMSSQQIIGNYTNNGWSNIPPGVVHGEPPPQKPTNTNKETPMQWTINEHGLTIYHEKSPSHSVFRHKSDADAISASPFAAYAPTQGSFLPFFTPSQQVVAATAGLSQQKRKQLNDASPSPPNMPNNLPVSSGFSIDRTIGNKNSTTGVTPNNNKSFRDFYSQLVHAAVNLQLTKNKKASVVSMTQEDILQLRPQNKFNLSPQRQNPRPTSSKSRHSTKPTSRKSKHCTKSTKSSRSVDSVSTCSSNGSCGSSKKGGKTLLQKTLLCQEHTSSATSSQTSFETTDTAATHGSSRTRKTQFSTSSVSLELPSAQSSSTATGAGGEGLQAAFHLSLQQDQPEKIIGESTGRLPSAQNGHLITGAAGDHGMMTAFRLSLQDHHDKIMGETQSKRISSVQCYMVLNTTAYI